MPMDQYNIIILVAIFLFCHVCERQLPLTFIITHASRMKFTLYDIQVNEKKAFKNCTLNEHIHSVESESLRAMLFLFFIKRIATAFILKKIIYFLYQKYIKINKFFSIFKIKHFNLYILILNRKSIHKNIYIYIYFQFYNDNFINN